MKNIEITYSITFAEMQNHIPMITIDNDVHNDGDIIHVIADIENNKEDLFFDCITGEYCFDCSMEQASNKLHAMGGIIQSHYYKHNSIADFLSEDNQQIMLDDLEEEIR